MSSSSALADAVGAADGTADDVEAVGATEGVASGGSIAVAASIVERASAPNIAIMMLDERDASSDR